MGRRRGEGEGGEEEEEALSDDFDSAGFLWLHVVDVLVVKSRAPP